MSWFKNTRIEELENTLLNAEKRSEWLEGQLKNEQQEVKDLKQLNRQLQNTVAYLNNKIQILQELLAQAEAKIKRKVGRPHGKKTREKSDE